MSTKSRKNNSGKSKQSRNVSEIPKLLLPSFVWITVIAYGLTRIPGVLNDLPPYQFCDETIYFNEVLRLVNEGSLISSEFRAGGFNIYPALMIVQIINLFLPAPMTSIQILIVGKVIYAVLLPLLSSIFVYKIAKLLVPSTPAYLTLLIYMSSSFYYSHFWYPDTHVHFGILGFIYFSLRIIHDSKLNKNQFLNLGMFLGISMSTKYTTLFLVAPLLILLLWLVNQEKFRKNVLLVIQNLSIGFIVTVLLLNFSSILKFDEFLEGFQFNLNNYASTSGTRYSGFLFYAAVLIFNGFGLSGLLFSALGLYKVRKNYFLILFLISYPIVLISVLGDKQWILSRNMGSAIPFLIPLIAIGINLFFSQAQKQTSNRKRGVLVGLTVFMSIPLISYSYLVIKDMTVDTRITASKWISENIDSAQTVGTNEFCFGDSPARVAGLNVTSDAFMNESLDYYVFSSYWDSLFLQAYKQKGVLTLIDQSKIHFEQWNSPKLFGSLGDVKFSHINLPSGYQVRERFKGNGPDILIVSKVQEGGKGETP
jgi:hypothetical protein